MKPVLEAEHISKTFNGLTVLKDVSFSLEKGTNTSIFGKNGSGKTTLFHIITGYINQDGGYIRYKNRTLNNKNPVMIARLGIGRTWQTLHICRNLSVLDNLILASDSHPGEALANYFIRPYKIIIEERKRITKASQILNYIGLGEKLEMPAGSLSIGQKKLLSIGMLLMNNSDLLLLDEPFSGLNEKMINYMSNTLVSLKQEGKTIFLIEHNQRKATSISDHIYSLEMGRIVQKKGLTS